MTGKPLQRPLTILGIETSCDETAAAVVRGFPPGPGEILSNIVFSQNEAHAPYGGVVPEIASRAHLEIVDGVIEQALAGANIALSELDGIAATAGPGLIGGVMVGLTTAKGLALASGKPLLAPSTEPALVPMTESVVVSSRRPTAWLVAVARLSPSPHERGSPSRTSARSDEGDRRQRRDRPDAADLVAVGRRPRSLPRPAKQALWSY